eukprot:TRINITY_DN16469_c0_g1_i1.p2 TRINITY_DN16469_c0_g1~~TRINITY_DN16469_c0_g1_i1.p2  ORF type:complete len:163 (+),score=14.24 TRINITY_DN16469_c0_g1_i1:114-602(+)
MLSLLQMIQNQKLNSQLVTSEMIPQPLLEFLNQTILGYLYGLENKIIEETLNQLSISNIIPKNKNTLIFDLDETLITSNIDSARAVHTFTLVVNEEIKQFNIAVRPFAKEIIEILSNYYEIIIFTASHIDYAKQITQFLDPQTKYLKFILDRSFCYETQHGV